MKKILIFSLLFASFMAFAQVNLNYQKPSQEILDLVDVPLAPSVLLNESKEYMVLRYRDQYKTIAELSEVELRLGGLRINPKTNIGSRTSYYKNLKIKTLKSGQTKQVIGLPSGARLANFAWSPDQEKMAMTHTTKIGVEVWIVDVVNAKATKITEAKVNANMGDVINWFEDGKSVLVKMLPSNRKPLINAASAVPSGPTISINNGGKAQNRTYQDLLKNKTDEFNFEQLAHSEIFKVSLDGTKKLWLPSAMYRSVSFSPDGSYVKVTTVAKPFSYIVPYYRFPSKSVVYSESAKKVETVVEVPLIENMPKGFMSTRKGKRSFSWRSDKPSTLTYVIALDKGDPAIKVDYRDEVFQLEAPFKGDGKSILKTKNRFAGISWGNDKTAIAYDSWWNNRNTKIYLFDPSDAAKTPTIISDRNYQDKYSDPGEFVTTRNKYGSKVLALKGKNAFLVGDGFSKKGQFPFVDRISLKSLKTKRLYQSKYTDKLERLWEYDPSKNSILVRIESKNEFPNYYFRNVKKNKLTQLTSFENPFKSIQNVEKEIINYKRADGLDLSATMYLPVGYDKTKKEKAPMIMWAYPREYKDKNSASQNTQNSNKFIYPFWGTMVYWVTKGYIVLDKTAFPIVGEGDAEPNDTFIPQLVSNAKAAIDAVDKLGYVDTKKIAVGGHSYGAFMVANLLSHCDYFAAGIARSGAYNRTLTPFGFQSEERSYWEAPHIYNTMSPFMNAEKMKYPLLLVHGEADNNSGTYPLQSKRYFNALKGLGATVRLLMLPKESHSYKAKESILHMLWEQDMWLEKYVKNNK